MLANVFRRSARATVVPIADLCMIEDFDAMIIMSTTNTWYVRCRSAFPSFLLLFRRFSCFSVVFPFVFSHFLPFLFPSFSLPVLFPFLCLNSNINTFMYLKVLEYINNYNIHALFNYPMYRIGVSGVFLVQALVLSTQKTLLSQVYV